MDVITPTVVTLAVSLGAVEAGWTCFHGFGGFANLRELPLKRHVGLVGFSDEAGEAAASTLRQLRNQIARGLPAAALPRPAYRLDEDGGDDHG